MLVNGEAVTAQQLLGATGGSGVYPRVGLQPFLESGNADDDSDSEEEFAIAAPRDRFNPTPYILLIALSLHAFIAGMALGLTTEDKEIVVTFIAIISHKATAAISLGISLIKSGVKRAQYFRLILLFSFTTPLGVLTGLFVGKAAGSSAVEIASAR